MLDPESAAFIQTGVSISLAAAGPDRLPSMSRGLGCKVFKGRRRIGVFIRLSQSADLLEHIRRNGKVANVFSQPSTNRTLQFKGLDAQVQPFSIDDLPLIEGHLANFMQEVLPLGLSEDAVRAILTFAVEDLVTVVYSPSAVFSQTPGPKAGERLKGAA